MRNLILTLFGFIILPTFGFVGINKVCAKSKIEKIILKKKFMPGKHKRSPALIVDNVYALLSDNELHIVFMDDIYDGFTVNLSCNGNIIYSNA